MDHLRKLPDLLEDGLLQEILRLNQATHDSALKAKPLREEISGE